MLRRDLMGFAQRARKIAMERAASVEEGKPAAEIANFMFNANGAAWRDEGKRKRTAFIF
jgi:hypothetical protein